MVNFWLAFGSQKIRDSRSYKHWGLSTSLSKNWEEGSGRVDLSNLYFITSCRFKKLITTIVLFHKNLRAKTSFFVALGKKLWRAKKVPLVQVCSLWAPLLPGPRLQVIGASQLPHLRPVSNCVCYPASACRGVSISVMAADSLGLTVRAPSFQA